jgi:glycosyltransferase involved in cell wall biosynthesis
MNRRIYFDALNLALERGTGIATYTRMLTQVARALGHQVGALYSSGETPAREALLREIALVDRSGAARMSRFRRHANLAADVLRCAFPIKPVGVDFGGEVVLRQFEDRIPIRDQVFVARNIFASAQAHFALAQRFTELVFDEPPDIFHATYQLPLRVRNARNIYTIHDLVPLRLPFTTPDNKRQMLRLLQRIAAKADHIVTVSEHSKRDIMRLLRVPETRVTNTYQAVTFATAECERPDGDIAEQLGGSHGLAFGAYLLFYGALEPKKNVRRLIEAYFASEADIPLVLVASDGWQNEIETRLLAEHLDQKREADRAAKPLKRRLHRLDYVAPAALVALIRGARAVLFPSLYEGFGLPILEAMTLGTPVLTSRESALPEIAGDAALLVDPYDTAEIARGITTIARDGDLRTELARRGRIRAEFFSMERYRGRVKALYDSLL